MFKRLFTAEVNLMGNVRENLTFKMPRSLMMKHDARA